MFVLLSDLQKIPIPQDFGGVFCLYLIQQWRFFRQGDRVGQDMQEKDPGPVYCIEPCGIWSPVQQGELNII